MLPGVRDHRGHLAAEPGWVVLFALGPRIPSVRRYMPCGREARFPGAAPMTQDLKTPHPRTNGPTASAKRFVAQVMEYTLREGWRTPDDFLRFFPPEVIMESLKSATELRVAILSRATGMHEQILQRKSLRLAAEDLRLSLSEGISNGFQLLEAFPAQDRIRYLDTQRLWDFLIEDQFWLMGDEINPGLLESSAARMAFTVSTALKEKLLTLRDVLEAITYESVADSLGPEELRSVVRYALLKGRDNIALSEKTLLEVLPLEKLLATVPLEHTWNEVVTKRLAIPNNLTDVRREERRASQSRSTPARTTPGRSAPSRSRPPSREPARRPSQRPPPSSAPNTSAYLPPAGPLASAVSGAMAGMPMSAPPMASAPMQTQPVYVPQREPVLETPRQPPVMSHGSSTSQDAEQQQRQRVSERLRAISRLPLAHERLPLPVLRSIDAMYSLLPSATDDIQRKSVIRAAFSGDHHLRMALLGLIELMDSSIDTTDPVIQEAKIDALIKILLFEEQRRKETGRMHAPGSSFPGRGSPDHATTSAGIGGPMPPRYATPPGSYPPPASQRPPGASYRDSSPPGPMSDLGSRPPPPGGRRRTVPPPLPPGAFGNDVPGPDRGLS
jgi:hypothetical protein